MGNNKFKILIVEDEANILSFIKANLETSDYQVLCAQTCALGMMMYASHHPDLIILDLGLPDQDGMNLIQEVRKTNTVPIIVLSARSNERDKVEMLDLGANDYITKPFGTEELLARIRAVLRSHRHSEDNESTPGGKFRRGGILYFSGIFPTFQPLIPTPRCWTWARHRYSCCPRPGPARRRFPG